MPAVRVKGVKRYRSKGRWYIYHRRSGTRIKAEFGTGAFFTELQRLERAREKRPSNRPGTFGGLLESYKSSTAFSDLAGSTRHLYLGLMDIVKALNDMPLAELTSPFVAALRDRVAERRGRRTTNLLLAVISVACQHGKERGLLSENPVRGLRRLKRERDAPRANRPWSSEECRAALDGLAPQLVLPVALAMFTGLRQGDVLTLKKSAIRNGRVWRTTSKTGQEVSIPIHPRLVEVLAQSLQHNAVTIAATARGTPWTSSGFKASFRTGMKKLEKDGKVESGLTFHGLRHTVGTVLIEAGVELDLVRRWLGHKTLAMAIHYSREADASSALEGALQKFDPLKSKTRTGSV